MIEIPNRLYVPDCTFIILSTDKITNHDMFLNTHGSGSYMMFPGFHDQLVGEVNVHIHQVVIDHVPTLVYPQGTGVPIITMQEVSSAEVWSHYRDPLTIAFRGTEQFDIAAIAHANDASPNLRPTPEFLAHITFLSECYAQNEQQEAVCRPEANCGQKCG